jgi:hypothetical protein
MNVVVKHVGKHVPEKKKSFFRPLKEGEKILKANLGLILC